MLNQLLPQGVLRLSCRQAAKTQGCRAQKIVPAPHMNRTTLFPESHAVWRRRALSKFSSLPSHHIEADLLHFFNLLLDSITFWRPECRKTSSAMSYMYFSHVSYATLSAIMAIGSTMPVLCIFAVALRFYTRLRQRAALMADDWLTLPALVSSTLRSSTLESELLSDNLSAKCRPLSLVWVLH